MPITGNNESKSISKSHAMVNTMIKYVTVKIISVWFQIRTIDMFYGWLGALLLFFCTFHSTASLIIKWWNSKNDY